MTYDEARELRSVYASLAHYKDLSGAQATTITNLEAARDALRWRKFPEEKPEVGQSVIAESPGAPTRVLRFDGNEWSTGMGFVSAVSVSKWIPLEALSPAT